MKDQLRDLAPLPPAAFFGLSWKVPKNRDFAKKSPFRTSAVLGPVDDLLLQEAAADVAITWDDHSLTFFWKIRGSFEENAFPRYRDGDSIELFIDTRNFKKSTAIHKFCHHLVFLPDETGIEMTRLRADDERPMADGLTCELKKEGRSTYISVTLSSDKLCGYEPKQFSHIGFAYRVNRHAQEEQSFPVSTRDISLESHPHMWATLVLEEK